ncbi:acetamidase/formamidase family protein [Thermopolyspora sp. NPDC052614]|uniref:acetamidase/formamidase family protein n=1 Tax=Thermopolyspora sp. NPDC052614 TaxID=3155682 RepID=UPI00344728C8
MTLNSVVPAGLPADPPAGIRPFEVLQAGQGVPPGTAYLGAQRGSVLWGRLPCPADRPVLRVEPGRSVVIDTVSHEGILEDQGRDPLAFMARYGIAADLVLRDAIDVARDVPHRPGDGPHVVLGPIAVTGARPGDMLAVRIEDLRPRLPYGFVSSRHGRGALPGEMPEGPGSTFVLCTAGEGPDGPVGCIATPAGVIRFPLGYFLGVIGVVPADGGRASSVPPGRHGGNLDISLLTAGSTLFLPVQVPDALVYVGDPHYAQGDGEVALTAFEAPLRATLRFDLIPRAAAEHMRALYGETDDLLIPVGLDEDLDRAMAACVRNGLDLLTSRYPLDRATAYAYLSAAADFAVSQVVDQVKGVHGRIRKSDLAALLSPEFLPVPEEM